MYKFSEISIIKYDKEFLGKYSCQVFDQDDNYIKSLIGDTYKEVYEMQKELKEGK